MPGPVAAEERVVKPAPVYRPLGWTGVLRYRDLLFALVATELKVKYRGSLLGFLWSLLNPLAQIAVYTVAFQYILRVQIEHFSIFLIAGLLPWGFFSGSSMASTISLMNAAALVKKVYFPREIIPAAVVLFNLIQTLLALVVFLPSMLVLRGGIPWALVFYPIVLALFALFSTGIALGLSALTVTFRDLRHLTEVVLAMLFWITPIVYSISMVPERLRVIFAFNPLTPFVSAFQDTAYWGRVPQPAVFLTMAIWAVGVLLVGWVIFRRLAPYLAEDL